MTLIRITNACKSVLSAWNQLPQAVRVAVCRRLMIVRMKNSILIYVRPGSGWNFGGRRCRFGRLDGYGEGCTPPHQGKGLGSGLGSLPRKIELLNFSFAMARFLCILSGIFCLCPCQKSVEFPPEVMIRWTWKMYFWEIVNSLSESWDW